jgi:hypothetical protein
VPAEWTASFWTTIEAAGNAAKYGESFEHTAEDALMYFFYSAFLGELAFGLAAVVVLADPTSFFCTALDVISRQYGRNRLDDKIVPMRLVRNPNRDSQPGVVSDSCRISQRCPD